MNERIKELAEQAGWTGLYTTYNEPTGTSDWKMVKESLTVPVTMEQIERFVELVRADEREKVAQWMMDKGYATGHGDSIEDLLREIEWQVAERERNACAKLVEADGLARGVTKDTGLVLLKNANRIRARGEK